MKNILALTFVWVVLASCATPQTQSPFMATEANLPNPASVYCIEQGFQSEIRTEVDGNQTGICMFPDGSECDEWVFYRGECGSASQEDTGSFSTIEIANDGCRIYWNEDLGYSFHYPADAQIITNDEPLKSFSVIGPMADGDPWPQFTISHPSDGQDYHPPDGVDLAQWLSDHNMLADARQPDLQIADTIAIHLRHDRSPQSYAYDRYFFAKSGQLYMILIGHAGDKEDWTLYNHFLESIQFE
jgi:putative hemolysin